MTVTGVREDPLDPQARADMERAYDAADAGNAADAIALCERVLARLPHAFAPHYLLGSLLGRQFRTDEAVTHLRIAVAARPESAVALFNLGVVLLDANLVDEALPPLQRAWELNPGDPEFAMTLAGALTQSAQVAEAERICRTALEQHPSHIALHAALANTYLTRHDTAAALQTLDKGLAVSPDDPALLARKAAVLLATFALKDAAAAADAALEKNVDTYEALITKGKVARQTGRGDVSLALFRRALELKPTSLAARVGLIGARLEICDWSSTTPFEEEVTPWLKRGLASVNVHDAQMLSDDPQLLQWIARTAMKDKGGTPAAPRSVDGNVCAIERSPRLRIGFLSGDLRDHPVGLVLAEVIPAFDRDRFRLIAFSTTPDDGSELRAQFRQTFDEFYDMERRSDDEFVAAIAAAGIDILIDVAGATEGGRLLVMQRRPAPIQVNYLGFAGTMGHPAWDYIIADPVLIPRGSEPFFDEAVVRLPDTYFPYSPRRVADNTPTRAECGLPEDAFVFCAFNALKKFARPTFEIWMRLLRNVPGAVLWISGRGAKAVENLRRAAAAAGVDPGRLIVTELVSMPEHMARHRHADLFLDTAPYNAHTTGADVLYMGVPMITCPGRAFQSRVAASLLHAHGLPELVTNSPEEYEALALALARDPNRLAALKAKTRANKATHPLFDTARYVRNFEAALQQMFDRHRAGLPPAGFDIG